MDEERKRKLKNRRKRQRVRRVWSAEEWLSKVDWGRFSPANPKRQAWEIIRRLANRTDEREGSLGSWAIRVRPNREGERDDGTES